jgi:hypothetical protein
VGPQLGFASNFSSSAKTGLGASIEYTGQFSEHLGARVYVGYDRFKGKYFAEDVVSFLPVRAGLQGFVYKDIFSVFAEAGVASFHAKSTEIHNSNFTYALGVAYRMPLGQSKQFLQVSGAYDYYRYSDQFHYSWYNIRLAYGLGFGRKNSEGK